MTRFLGYFWLKTKASKNTHVIACGVTPLKPQGQFSTMNAHEGILTSSQATRSDIAFCIVTRRHVLRKICASWRLFGGFFLKYAMNSWIMPYTQKGHPFEMFSEAAMPYNEIAVPKHHLNEIPK